MSEINDGREESDNPAEFSADYKQGWRDAWDKLSGEIKSAIETYEAVIFICDECGNLAYMIDPGDGLVSHFD